MEETKIRKSPSYMDTYLDENGREHAKVNLEVNEDTRPVSVAQPAVTSPPINPNPVVPIQNIRPKMTASNPGQNFWEKTKNILFGSRNSTEPKDSNAEINNPQKTTEKAMPWYGYEWEQARKINNNATADEYIRQNTKYRAENNLPEMSLGELAGVLKGRDPYQNDDEAARKEKNLRIAENINSIGNVLVNLLNVARTNKGHVAMDTSGMGNYAQQRIDQIRRENERLRQNHYQDYISAWTRDRADKARRESIQAQYDQALRMENARQNSPLNQQRILTESQKTGYWNEAAKSKELDNEYKPIKQKGEQEYNRAKINQARASASASNAKTAKTYQEMRTGNGGNGKSYIDVEQRNGAKKTYNPRQHGANWIQQAYNDMINQTGGDKSTYKINNLLGNSPSSNDMYQAITRYNTDIKRIRPRGGKPPLN